ncbi:hypothetical protein PUR23_15700 [Methylorubrum populi]|uniref:hypothetical protein n=1 Tax=Methylorubrum populi TaxID=223967 RepID=UPI0031FA23CD
MSVAIHPSETRRTEGQAPSRLRLPVLVGAAGGSVALLAFAVGAFSFFSDLADPRSRPVRIAPVASQWPDLKDGVPALAPSSAGLPNETRRETRQASLPAAEPAISAAMPAALPVTLPAAQVQAAAPESPPPAPARAPLPIEPAATVPAAARTAATVTPTKVAVPLPPSRSETVRAKTEQPAQFVSLPAPKAKPEPARTEAKAEIKSRAEGKAEAVKETAKETAKKAEAAKIDPARKPAPVARNRAAEPRPTQTASAQAPAGLAREAADEPELLGVKIPGGRQIREGWDAAVSGLLGGKSAGE